MLEEILGQKMIKAIEESSPIEEVEDYFLSYIKYFKELDPIKRREAYFHRIINTYLEYKKEMRQVKDEIRRDKI